MSQAVALFAQTTRFVRQNHRQAMKVRKCIRHVALVIVSQRKSWYIAFVRFGNAGIPEKEISIAEHMPA